MAKKIPLILKIVFSGLLIVSFGLKIANPHTYVDALKTYQLFSDSLIPLIVYYVPALELIIALGLLVPKYSRSSQWALLILLVSFQITLLSLLLRGIDADCGCFGQFGGTPLSAFIRNIVLMIGLIYWLIKFPNEKKDESIKPELG